MQRRWAMWLPLVPVWLLFLWCGFRGLDFGRHFDEHIFVIPLKRLARGQLLPNLYNYPSLAYYLSFLAAIPEIVMAPFSEEGFFARVSSLREVVNTHAFRLRLRGLYLLITSAALVWIYASVLAAKRSVPAAVLAVLVVATSYEVSYHSRWFAPDGPLLMFSAFTVWTLVRAERATDWASARTALVWAAIGAGLATGTKYTAGLYLFVVLALALCHRARLKPELSAWAAVQGPLIVYAVVYLATTPATILDAREWLEQIELQRRTYAGGHRNYTVERGLDHLSRMLLYLGGGLWSPYLGLAAAVTGLGLFGAVHMYLTRRRLALVVFAVPVLFVGVFTMQKTMIVRNLLVIVPSLAFGVAWGFDVLLSVRRRWVRGLAVAAASAAVAVNAGFVLWAAETVYHRRDVATFAKAAAQHVERLGDDRVFVSAAVARRMREATGVVPDSVGRASDADWLVFHVEEGFDDTRRYPANHWRMAEATFGSYEVSFNRYPSFWGGERRILVMRADVARQVGLSLLSASRAP